MRKNAKSSNFGKWFRQFVDSYPEIKKKAIASKAGISAVSFSRILSGEHGVSSSTAENLMNAFNNLIGTNIININEGLNLINGSINNQNNFAEKIKTIMIANQIIIDFHEEDFEWLAQLIEMRFLWKNSQNRSTVQDGSPATDVFFPPDEIDGIQEPAAINVQQHLKKEANQRKVHSLNNKKKGFK